MPLVFILVFSLASLRYFDHCPNPHARPLRPESSRSNILMACCTSSPRAAPTPGPSQIVRLTRKQILSYTLLHNPPRRYACPEPARRAWGCVSRGHGLRTAPERNPMPDKSPASKLLLKPGQRAAILNAPDGYPAALDVPCGRRSPRHARRHLRQRAALRSRQGPAPARDRPPPSPRQSPAASSGSATPSRPPT